MFNKELANRNPLVRLGGFILYKPEVLFQSHNNEIHLLPALPDAWETGEISGFKAMGNIEVNIKWEREKID